MNKLILNIFFNVIVLFVIISCEKNITPYENSFIPDVVFISDRDGNNDVFVMNLNGEFQTNLTKNNNPNSYPSFSDDGKCILFMSRIEDQFDILIMNNDGSELKSITETTFNEVAPIFYHNSNRIIYNSDENSVWQLFSINIDGSEKELLTSSNDNYYYPTISPDEQRIAYQSDCEGNRELFIMDIDGTNKIKLTNTDHIEQSPVFYPNGQKLLYNAKINNIDYIYSMNIDGTDIQNLTADITVGCYLPVFTADEQHIVFLVDRRQTLNGGVLELYIMDIDGGNKRALVEKSGSCWSPEVVSNSATVIFQNDLDGDYEICTIDLSSNHKTVLTSNSSHDGYPKYNTKY